MANKSIYWLCGGWVGGILCAEALWLGIGIAPIGAALSLLIFLVLLFRENIFDDVSSAKNVSLALIVWGSAAIFGYQQTALVLRDYERNRAFVAQYKIEEFGASVIREPDIRSTTTWYVVQSHTVPAFRARISLTRYPKYSIGDQLVVRGSLQEPEAFETPGGVFDYPGYLMKDGISHVSYYPRVQKVSEELGWWVQVQKRLQQFKGHLVSLIAKHMPSPHAELVAGMLLGVKQSLGEQLLSDLQKIGLIHLVVLSGFNITILITTIQVSTKKFPKALQLILAVLLVSVFVVLVGPTPSVVRAACMSMLAFCAKLLERESDGLRLLILATLIMSYVNPLIIVHDPSFQLSWLATFGVILLPERIEKRLSYVPSFLGIRATLAQTLAAQLTTLPRILTMTGAISWIAPVSNVVVAPMVAWIMAAGALLISVASVWHGAAALIGFVVARMCDVILYLVAFFAAL